MARKSRSRTSHSKQDAFSNSHGLRQRLATEAARIMATEGQHQYFNAKQKAAQRLGADPRQGLPSNAEVASALKDYLSFYGGKEREQAVAELLETALKAMRWLEPLEPRLSGALVDGIADQNSPIQIHVFSDDPDAPIRYLMEHDLPYEQGQKRIRWYDDELRNIETLSFEAGTKRVELWVFDKTGQRQAPPSPINGKPRERLNYSAAEQLLHEQRLRC